MPPAAHRRRPRRRRPSRRPSTAPRFLPLPSPVLKAAREALRGSTPTAASARTSARQKGRVPSGVEVLKRNGLGDGMCPLCDTVEDSNHIFFACATAQFLWSCFREAVGGHWFHTNVPDLFAEIQSVPPSARQIRWLTIGALVWTLWTVRNKLVIQRAPLRRSTGAVFKMCGFLQLWRPLSRPSDRDAINTIIADLRLMALRMAPPLPPPPPEPD